MELQSTFSDLMGGGNSLKGQRTLRRWPFFMGVLFGNGGEVAGHSGLGFDRWFFDGWVYCLAWVMWQMGYCDLMG